MSTPDPVPDDLPAALADALRAPLVDQHGHGVRRAGLDRAEFEQAMNACAAPPGTTGFDSPAGAAIRRWCAPVLGLEPHAAPATYLERRTALGAEEAGRLLLRAAGVSAFFVDAGEPRNVRAEAAARAVRLEAVDSRTAGGPAGRGSGAGEPRGGRPDAAVKRGGRLDATETARLAGSGGHAIICLERIAAAVAAREPAAHAYADELAEELRARARRAVALKSVIAGHAGLAVDPMPPEPGEVTAAAGRWIREGGHDRLADPVLLRHGLWAGLEAARDRKIPLQFQVGAGDLDAADLHRSDPLALAPFLRAAQPYGVPIILVNTDPYVRQAACLAATFPHVYLDIGAALATSAAGSATLIADALAAAPFHKILYGSGGRGLPEQALLAAVYHRRGLARALAARVDDGEWTVADAAHAARLIGADNARRVYRLAG